MKDVKESDLVQTSSGFEPVVGFMHSSLTSTHLLHLTHANGTLKISPDHLVFLADGSSKRSRRVVVGDVLASGEGSLTIEEVGGKLEKGIFAPLTPSGTIVV